MIRVAIGSCSQYKIDATRDAMRLVLPDEPLDVVSVDAASGVSAQPMSNEESIQGARNRARVALQATGADIAIGIENGLSEVDDVWFANTWIAAIDAHGGEGLASTIHRPVPPRLMTRIHSGWELSDAVREEIPAEVRERYVGLIGIITNGVLNRHDVLRDGIVVAMSSLLQSDLYRGDG
ncbi:MAG: inosine/xanthosine triphosphatase [Thermomicrobiales bacterium]|nr:inosine/xanthosine triphosphatase [Thermomicrobiales bacterium]